MKNKEIFRSLFLAGVIASTAACGETIKPDINPIKEPSHPVYVAEPTNPPVQEPKKDPLTNKPLPGITGGVGENITGQHEGQIVATNISQTVKLPESEFGKNSIGLFSDEWIKEDGNIDMSKPAIRDLLLGKQRTVSLPKDSFLVLEARSMSMTFGAESSDRFMKIDVPLDVNKPNLIVVRGGDEDVLTTFKNYPPNSTLRIYTPENQEELSFLNEDSFKNFIGDKKPIVTMFDIKSQALTVFSEGESILSNISVYNDLPFP